MPRGTGWVIEASEMRPPTRSTATHEVRASFELSVHQRRLGAANKAAIDKQPGLFEVLPETRGSLRSRLRRTVASTYDSARELIAEGYRASAELVHRRLHQEAFCRSRRLGAVARWEVAWLTIELPTNTAR